MRNVLLRQGMWRKACSWDNWGKVTNTENKSKWQCLLVVAQVLLTSGLSQEKCREGDELTSREQSLDLSSFAAQNYLYSVGLGAHIPCMASEANDHVSANLSQLPQGEGCIPIACLALWCKWELSTSPAWGTRRNRLQSSCIRENFVQGSVFHSAQGDRGPALQPH